MSKILNMLMDFSEQGFSIEEMKEAVISKIQPFFSHPQNAALYWTSAEMLSVFEFLIRYAHDPTFEDALHKVLAQYKCAVEMDSEETMSIVCSTLFDFSQKENMMWTVRKNVKYISNGDYDERIISIMKHIGDTLEIGTKHLVLELWAITQVANGKIPDYEKIKNMDFGVAVQGFVDKQKFLDILMTEPQSLRISDWRNIAYHHTYRIIDENEIKCTYGKQKILFSVTEQQLMQYTHQVIRSSNILNIARCIFVFDFDEQIAQYRNAHERAPIRFRTPILENRLRISMLSQSFYLEGVVENQDSILACLIDLKNTGTLNPEQSLIRRIHTTQLLYNLWCSYQKNEVRIDCYSAQHTKILSCKVGGSICREIAEGKQKLEYLARHVAIEHFSQNK